RQLFCLFLLSHIGKREGGRAIRVAVSGDKGESKKAKVCSLEKWNPLDRGVIYICSRLKMQTTKKYDRACEPCMYARLEL
ncbi:unnamed protein product, partial [Scytosiphon promiscuus]